MNKRDLVRFRKDWSTHIPMLIKYVQKTDKNVMELGSGLFSTPLLHWLCRDKKLVTYENVPEYYQFAKKFQWKNHSIRFIEDWDKLKTRKHWGVIFIDHNDGHRGEDAIKFKDNADYIIIHDSNADCYGYDNIWKHFKYRCDWKECKPWTTVLSNFKEL